MFVDVGRREEASCEVGFYTRLLPRALPGDVMAQPPKEALGLDHKSDDGVSVRTASLRQAGSNELIRHSQFQG